MFGYRRLQDFYRSQTFWWLDPTDCIVYYTLYSCDCRLFRIRDISWTISRKVGISFSIFITVLRYLRFWCGGGWWYWSSSFFLIVSNTIYKFWPNWLYNWSSKLSTGCSWPLSTRGLSSPYESFAKKYSIAPAPLLWSRIAAPSPILCATIFARCGLFAKLDPYFFR